MKPRLSRTRAGLWWVCSDKVSAGYGCTPKQAYDHWVQMGGMEEAHELGVIGVMESQFKALRYDEG